MLWEDYCKAIEKFDFIIVLNPRKFCSDIAIAQYITQRSWPQGSNEQGLLEFLGKIQDFAKKGIS